MTQFLFVALPVAGFNCTGLGSANAPGVAVVVFQDNKVEFAKGYGVADMASL